MRISTQSMRVSLFGLIVLVAGVTFTTPASAGFYMREEAQPLLIKADENQDGFLSRPELRAEDPSLLCGFDRADVDRNGKLDLGEFEMLLISL